MPIAGQGKEKIPPEISSIRKAGLFDARAAPEFPGRPVAKPYAVVIFALFSA